MLPQHSTDVESLPLVSSAAPFVLLLLLQHLILNTTQLLIRAFKFDLDWNPSSWHFWWKGVKNRMIISFMCSVEGMILWTWSITITGKFHFRPSSSYKKSPWKLRGNYHECVWNRELHAAEIILHSFRPLSFPFFFCLWITFNLQSKQLWRGLWSFDGRQKEAVGEWVWGNEAAMSRNDLWAFPSCSLSPHRDTVSSNIALQKNSILTTHQVITVPFQEVGQRCLFNMLFRASQWYVSKFST